MHRKKSFWENLQHRWYRPMTVGWFLAIRQIRRGSKWTTLLIISIMVLTFLNLVVVTGLLVGLIAGSFSQFRDSYSGDVFITPKPGSTYIENTPTLIKYLDNHPDVTALSYRYTINGLLLGTLTDNPKVNQEANEAGVAVMGMDFDREEKLTEFSKFVIKGEMLSNKDDGYIMIGSNLLKQYSNFADVDIPGLNLLENVDLGSKVRLTVSSASEEGHITKTKDYIVKAILKSKIDQISTKVFLPESEIRQYLNNNQWEVQEIGIRTAPGTDLALVQELKNYVGDKPIRIQASAEAIPAFLRDIEDTMAILGNALSSIALVVALITVFIVIFINAVTRRKFIGILKGIGIEPQAIQFSYVFQAIFYSVCGSAIGLILTFGLLRPYFEAHPIDFPFSDGILVATAEGAMIRVIILLSVTIFAGFLPATLIVRKNTLDSILGR